MPTEDTGRFSEIEPIERDNIQDLMKGSEMDHWRAPIKQNVSSTDPCDPSWGRNIAPMPREWLTIEAALEAYDRGIGDGIGIVMSPTHIMHTGVEHYLVALRL